MAWPCGCVSQQGSGTLRISWRRTLLKIIVENVRPATSATEEEVVGQEMVQEELLDHQKQLSGHGPK